MSDNDEPFVTLRYQRGNFNLADPSEKFTEVHVKIPKYDYDETIAFDEPVGDYLGIHWHDDIDELCRFSPRHIGGREKLEELDEILHEHGDEIHEEWEKHRKQEIEDEIESLKEEKQSL